MIWTTENPIRLVLKGSLLLLIAGMWFSVGQGMATAQSAPHGETEQETESNELVKKLVLQRSKKQIELDELQGSVSLSQEKITEIQSEINKLQGDTANLKLALIASAGRRRALEDQIDENEKQIQMLSEQETLLKTSLNKERDVLADVLAALQRMGRNPPPALLVSPGDALDSVRSAILLNGVVPEMRAKMKVVLGDLRQLQAIKQQQLDTSNTLADDLVKMAEEAKRMDLLITENDKASMQSAESLDAERQQAEALAARATDLDSLISTLENEITSVRNAALLARQEAQKREQMSPAQKKQARDLVRSSTPDKNRIGPAYPFSELKKKLILPVKGAIVRNYGGPDGAGHKATGITIAARAGALVTAPADGTIVYAGRFRSYGEMVILNVGDGYHIVMTGMSGLKVHQGDFVFSGEPLADMGNKSITSAATLALETDKPTLYIEFRQNGKPVDSHSWWAEKNDGETRNDT